MVAVIRVGSSHRQDQKMVAVNGNGRYYDMTPEVTDDWCCECNWDISHIWTGDT
jgi:hypothetical protein